MDDLIEIRLSELKKKSFAELLLLEDYQGEKIEKRGKKFTVSVWKDQLSDSKLRIVVQVYRYWFLGIGKMDAEGFEINNEGKINSIRKTDMFEFT